MSAIEKNLVQIFDRKKRIIEHARQESRLWEYHLLPKLILNGIPPPPWLTHSDPKDLNRHEVVSEGLLSRTQFGIPFTGQQCSLYSNLDTVFNGVQYPVGLRNEVCDFKNDSDMGRRLSILPDCSVNNAGCASSDPPELDSGAISPQNQIEPRVSESFHDPAVSLAKLQRSRSRQKALEERNSAKASNRLSGDGDNAGDCTATATGSAPPSLQEDHIKDLSLVNEFQPNSQSCLMEEVRREDCLTQKGSRSNYSGRKTRSKASSQKFNSSSAGISSVEKEDGPPLNDLKEVMELVNRPSFINEICGVQEPNIIEFQNNEVGSSVYDKSLAKPKSSSQAEHNSELLNLDSSSGRYKVVGASDLKQPCSHVELTDLSKTSDCINGSRRSIVKDGDFCQTNQESNIRSRLRLHKSSCPSPGDDFFITGGSVNSIDKSVQLLQPLISKNLQDPSVAIVGSFGSQKEPDISAGKTKEQSSRSGSGKAYLTRNSKFSKSPNSNSRERSAVCSESAGKKSQNVQLTKLDHRRLSTSPKYSKLDVEISVNSAEKENIAEVGASRNTRAVTSHTTEGPLISSSIDGGSLLAESLYIKAAVAEKDLDVQENIASDVNSNDNAEHRSAATNAKVHLDFDGLVDNEPSCLGSRLNTANPKVREDVSVLRLSPDFVVSVIPKQLVFDDGEETNRDGIISLDLKEGYRRMSLYKEPPALSEPLKLLDDIQEVLADSFSEAVTENDLLRHSDKSVTNFNVRFSSGSPTDDTNVDLAQQAPNTICLGQSGDLLPQALLSNGKVTNFSTDCHNFKSSTQSFTNNVEHSCSQHKRRKVEIETEKFLPDSTLLAEKLVDSIDQRPASGTSSIKEDNPEAVIEVLHLAYDQADSIGDQHASNSPTDAMEDTEESKKMEGSSVKVRKEEKLIFDGRGRSSDNLMLPETNPFSFSIDSMRFSMDEKAGSWHLEVNSGQDSAEHLTCVERSTSSRRINPGGDTEFSDGLSVSPGLRDLNLIGTGEALPEFEGFLMQTDNAQPCTARDEMELESLSLPSNSVDYTSLGRSRFMHSPSCYSSTPYKLHSLANLYQSLPNGLLEGYGLRTSRPAYDGSPRSLSDCRPNCNGQFTSSVQTLWDRFNSNFGSSGKRKSSKPELPCINEENENVDEIAGTFQRGIGSEGITRSITRGLLADIVDNANPSTSVLQDALASGRKDSVSSEFNFDGTPNKIKKKPDMQNGNGIRFANKGKENKSVVNGAKRNSESVRKRSSRSKLSGKNSMKDPVNGTKRNSESVRKRSSRSNLSGKNSLKQRCPTFSGGKSTRSNIVSNLTSFIPLVQQKQAAAVFTGKRVINVPSLIKAEAAKRNADIKANEQKKRKEFMMEQQKKKKEEEEMAAKEKKQREIEEKKEKDRKRKLVNDMKQQEHGKMHAKKARTAGEEVRESRKIDNRNNLLLQENRQGNAQKISETEPLTISDPANNKTKESCYDKSESVSECANKGKAKMVDLIKAVIDNDSIIKNSLQAQSYEMSPYRSDDDEDDDVPNNKFMPSWASKHSLSMIISSQKIDPERIFPRQSFCDIAKVLLPRRLLL